MSGYTEAEEAPADGDLCYVVEQDGTVTYFTWGEPLDLTADGFDESKHPRDSHGRFGGSDWDGAPVSVAPKVAETIAAFPAYMNAQGPGFQSAMHEAQHGDPAGACGFLAGEFTKLAQQQGLQAEYRETENYFENPHAYTVIDGDTVVDFAYRQYDPNADVPHVEAVGPFEDRMARVTFPDDKPVLTAGGDWDEAKHPRDAHGRFGDKDGGEGISAMLEAVPASPADVPKWLADHPEGRDYQKTMASWSVQLGGGAAPEDTAALEKYLPHAPVIDQPLYRGTNYRELVPGERISFGLSSFSRDREVGLSYVYTAGEVDPPEDETGSLFELDPGARALPVDGLSHWQDQDEKEVVTAGNFEVVSVGHEYGMHLDGGYPVVRIRQVR